VVDATRAELDGELDASRLRELVRVEPKREPALRARVEVAPRLANVERATLEEDVGGLGDRRRLGQHLGEREVEVRVGVVELRRDGMRAEPRRHSARRGDRAELRELRLAVEAVAGLRLPRRGPAREHRRGVAYGDDAQPLLSRRARGANRREDPAARGVELLVGRATGSKVELSRAIAGEARVGVAVDEAWDRCAAPPVELVVVVRDRP
jgi:hypothetical protein